MAIKPITNDNAPNESSVNREEQLTIRSDVGNPRVTIRTQGGRDATKSYAIGVKDIDTAVINHMKNVMKPVVKEANEIIKVPVLYANEERWKSVRGRGTIRDRNNSIILPIILVRRTSLGMNPDMPLSFDNDVKGKFISVVRSSNGWSKSNRYDRFAVLTGQQPVQEFIKTGMPDFVICNYTIVMMTAFMEQMNDLNTIMVEHLETYWGDQTSHRFLSALEGDISNEEQMESQGERLIRNEITLSMKGYMIPEFTDTVLGKTAEMGRAYKPKKVSFSEKII